VGGKRETGKRAEKEKKEKKCFEIALM